MGIITLKQFKFYFLISIIYFHWISMAEGSNILIGAPFATKSHKNGYVSLVKELGSRGHNITVITNYETPDFTGLDYVREIIVEELAVNAALYSKHLDASPTLAKKLDILWSALESIFNYPLMIAEKTYAHPKVKQLLATDTYDLVVAAEASDIQIYPMAWHFRAHLIVLGPNMVLPGRGPVLGDDDHLSYSPFFMSPFSDQMTFFERTINFVIAKTFLYFYHVWPQSQVRSIIQRSALPDCPPIGQIEKNISIVFTNTHPSFNYPRSLPPQIIEVGGMHCRPARPLTDEKLEKFVSSSGYDGFIIFAIGSVMRMEDMPEHILQALLKSFSSLPQRVVWQWKGEIRIDLPKNVLALSWLPQQDLLGHKNCKAFVTHGGLNSIQEAIYHGIPLLGIPFTTDQYLNMKKATKDGYAISLTLANINQTTMTDSLNQLLQNASFKAKAEKFSRMFRDQPETPLERAVYWTEYVIRHGGVDHLRLGSRNLLPLQRSLIDVYFVLFTFFCILPMIALSFCVKKLRTRRPAHDLSAGRSKSRKNK